MLKAARRRPKKISATQRLLRAHLHVLQDLSSQLLKGAKLLDGSEPPPSGRFVQCWAMPRGSFAAVTQALDDQGQVWERVSLIGEKMVEGKKVKFVEDSWWEAVGMKKREEPPA